MNDRPQHGAFSLNNLFPVVFIKYDADKEEEEEDDDDNVSYNNSNN